MPNSRRTSDFVINLALAGWTAYGMLVTLMLILKFTIGEYPLLGKFGSPVGAFNSMLQVALFPAIPGLLLCLLLRRPRLAAWHLPAVALFVVMYGGNFVPHLAMAAATDEASDLSLLTYNLLYTNPDYDQVIEIIKDADADVVALQELTGPASDRLKEAFQETYPYQALHQVGLSTAGAGILSRLPILKDDVWLDFHQQQQVVLQVDDQTVTLFNVHPPIPLGFGANAQLRTATIRHILDQSAQVSGRVILAGDFNMGDGSDDYAAVTRNYTDSFKVAGYGFGLSFPDWSWHQEFARFLPVLARLDYVFYNEGIQATRAWTSHRSGGSDHRPYYVELTLTGN